MKKIYKSLLLAMVAALPMLTSCSDDNDSNPVMTFPETFVLNTPEFAANNVYDLPYAEFLNLTVNTQPNYGGFPAAVTYAVQISLDNADDSWKELSTTYTSTKINVPAVELNTAILEMYRAAHEDADPEGALPLYIRLRAYLAESDYENFGEVFSNAISLNVLSYEIPSELSLPTAVYVCGNSIDEAWSTWKPLIPVFDSGSGKDGRFYTMIYNGGDGFKWGYKPNDWFGYDMIKEFDNQVEDLEITAADDGNIVFSKAGWYVLEFICKIVGNEIQVKVVVAPGMAKVIGNCVDGGSWNAQPMTAPAGKGEWTFADFGSYGDPAELRAFIEVPGEDWWRTEFTVVDGQLVFRDKTHNCDNNWRDDVGEDYSIAVAGKTLKVNFDNNTGSVE
ncbi:MAG: SusF/SusE family outer membrane protein [Prevotella sp.]|nr:SusF/SusE family outer membrane protein [Prevotella sp.]